MKREVLVIGGAGFLATCRSGGYWRGDSLSPTLTWCVMSTRMRCEMLTSIQEDIRDVQLLQRTFAKHKFEVVLHCAAMLAHNVSDKTLLWTSNVDGKRIVAAAALATGVWIKGGTVRIASTNVISRKILSLILSSLEWLFRVDRNQMYCGPQCEIRAS